MKGSKTVLSLMQLPVTNYSHNNESESSSSKSDNNSESDGYHSESESTDEQKYTNSIYSNVRRWLKFPSFSLSLHITQESHRRVQSNVQVPAARDLKITKWHQQFPHRRIRKIENFILHRCREYEIAIYQFTPDKVMVIGCDARGDWRESKSAIVLSLCLGWDYIRLHINWSSFNSTIIYSHFMSLYCMRIWCAVSVSIVHGSEREEAHRSEACFVLWYDGGKVPARCVNCTREFN